MGVTRPAFHHRLFIAVGDHGGGGGVLEYVREGEMLPGLDEVCPVENAPQRRRMPPPGGPGSAAVRAPGSEQRGIGEPSAAG